MEPTDALRSIETALRLAIRDVLGEQTWLSAVGAPDEDALAARRDEEAKRRDGAVVSANLIDYTETYHLTKIIARNWEPFQVVFEDKKRTEVFFGVIEDVRNSIAHSRDLIPFERDLISGIAGMIRNQVSIFRAGRDNSSRYYPLIERLVDHLGVEMIGAARVASAGTLEMGRVDVGTELTFSGSAFNAKGRAVNWQLIRKEWPNREQVVATATGDVAELSYTVAESDVAEWFVMRVQISADSRYHRTKAFNGDGYDDSLEFHYAVNPPGE